MSQKYLATELVSVQPFKVVEVCPNNRLYPRFPWWIIKHDASQYGGRRLLTSPNLSVFIPMAIFQRYSPGKISISYFALQRKVRYILGQEEPRRVFPVNWVGVLGKEPTSIYAEAAYQILLLVSVLFCFEQTPGCIEIWRFGLLLIKILVSKFISIVLRLV